MNDTNPFIPQGSLLEQKNKKRARVKVAVLAIFALNILLISPLLLIQACKRGDQAQNEQDTNTTADTGMAVATSNLPPVMTNSNLIVATSNIQTQVQPPGGQPQIPVAADITDYVILPHDTYSSIAKKFPGLTVKALEAANPDVPATKLMPGKKIKIPPSTGPMAVAGGASDDNMYLVKPGDNLTTIARKYGTSVKTLQDLNDLKTTAIKAGQKLKVPVKVASTGMTTEPAPSTTTASNPMSMPPQSMR